MKAYLRLDRASMARYEGALLAAMKAARAAYGVFVFEAGERFADRFVEVDGRRLIDQCLPDGTFRPADKIWVDPEQEGSPPIGIELMEGASVRDGVFEYIRADTP